uniref:Transmembrane protein 254 n=1 Tax=Amphilophus citrinellus TaxID=61819 RepID=A0A3Q0SE10_AMPCI
MAESDGGDYFKRTSLFWMVTVTLAVIYFACTVFVPDIVPFEFLGPFGSFSKNIVYNYPNMLYKGWWATWAIHLSEALIALKVCSNKGINNTSTRCLWFIQTFLFGFASLGLLIKYDPERRKQH